MKRKEILFVIILSVLCLGNLLEAEPLGTAFTYQGRLIDNNDVADGLYDFQFKLYDAASDDNQLNGDVNTPDVDVIDGYFTVELDFGNEFNGDKRWLEIGVRPGDMNDPNVYTFLDPRQEITPVPYAIYADGSNWNNLIGVPADIADGDNDTDTQLSEAQVDAYVANNGYLDTETDPTVVASVKDGVSWEEVSNRPAGLDDGDDVGGVPSGAILMWSGSIASIPTGWALCDGTNGTPDLTSRFIRSVPNAATDPGSTGGSIQHDHGGATEGHTLTVTQMPSHRHRLKGGSDLKTNVSGFGHWDSFGVGSPLGFQGVSWYDSDAQANQLVENTGSSQAHSHGISSANHLPPYYALAYIMKLP